jgi:hypothetical protein
MNPSAPKPFAPASPAVVATASVVAIPQQRAVQRTTVDLPKLPEILAAARIALVELEGLESKDYRTLPSWVPEVLNSILADQAKSDPKPLHYSKMKQLHDATRKVNQLVKQLAKAKKVSETDSQAYYDLTLRVDELRANRYYFNLLTPTTRATLLGDLSRHSIASLTGTVEYAERTYARYDRDADRASQPTRRPGAPKRRGNAEARKRKSAVNAAIIAARTGKSVKKN